MESEKPYYQKQRKLFQKKKIQIFIFETSFKILCKENPEIHKEDNTI